MNALFSRILLSVALVLLIATPSLGVSLTGVVTKVADGDTVTIQVNGKEETVRLIGIDAPSQHSAPGTPRRLSSRNNSR